MARSELTALLWLVLRVSGWGLLFAAGQPDASFSATPGCSRAGADCLRHYSCFDDRRLYRSVLVFQLKRTSMAEIRGGRDTMVHRYQLPFVGREVWI